MLEKDATIKKFEYWPLGSELKKLTGIIKDQYTFFKDQIENMSCESNTTAEFDAILKGIKYHGRTT